MFGITDEKSLPKKNTFMAELRVLPFRLPATRILYCEMSRLLPQEDSVFNVLTGGCYSNESMVNSLSRKEHHALSFACWEHIRVDFI